MNYGAYLHARPMSITTSASTGIQPLNFGSKRDSYYYVPRRYNPFHPAPVVLLLHGAGGHAHHGLDILRPLADDFGLILVAPASTHQTWDVIVESGFRSDVALVDQCLQQIFKQYAVDDSHLAIGGFSDGASYALSLGLPNGDLFTHVIAFSPGFFVKQPPRGKPRVFISHGTKDPVLPIEPCSRRLVPTLRRDGYEVDYHEFDGEHTIPPDIAQRAVDWMMR